MQLIVDFPQASSEQPTPAPAVSFTSDVEIVPIENLTCKYKDDLWFANREMQLFKYNAARVLRRLKSMNITMVQYAEMNIEDTR